MARWCAGQPTFQPGKSLGAKSANVPVLPERTGELQRDLRLLRLVRPGQGRAQVIQFAVETLKPVLLLGADEQRLDLLGKILIPERMTLPDRRLLAMQRQLLPPKVADRFQHAKAWFLCHQGHWLN